MQESFACDFDPVADTAPDVAPLPFPSLEDAQKLPRQQIVAQTHSLLAANKVCL